MNIIWRYPCNECKKSMNECLCVQEWETSGEFNVSFSTNNQELTIECPLEEEDGNSDVQEEPIDYKFDCND